MCFFSTSKITYLRYKTLKEPNNQVSDVQKQCIWKCDLTIISRLNAFAYKQANVMNCSVLFWFAV